MNEAAVIRAVELANSDGEFAINSASLTFELVLAVGVRRWRIVITAGEVSGPFRMAASDVAGAADVVAIAGNEAAWATLLQANPPPGFTDLFGAAMRGELTITPGVEEAGRHHAIRRFGELLRHAHNGTDASPALRPAQSRHGEHDKAVGRYVHLELGGLDHRVYYEESGSGIGLICQHTAGADARQWRHLLEDDRVTEHFRVIAYDMPYHARSLPPEGRAWWAEEYNLTTEAAMELPVALAEVLQLDRPVFIGSSVGGMLALDLARYHPDQFRAVIALEGGLRSSADRSPEAAEENLRRRARRRRADPALHGASMMSIMSPTAPETYRQEVMLHYAQGAPGVHIGDTYYYTIDHDLRAEADLIDTARCPVYLLTGEYDFSTVEVTKTAGEAIAGASIEIMRGLGHFPMAEDYERLSEYVLPILEEIRAG